MVKTYQMAVTITATSSNQVNITIRRDCRLLLCQYAMSFDGPADNARVAAALSVNPTSQIGTNDGQGSLVQIDSIQNILTSGGGNAGVNGFVPLPAIPLRQNDMLYIHGTVAGTVSAIVTLILFVQEGS